MDKGELDAEIDQFLSGKKSRGGFECHSFVKNTTNEEPHSTKWKVRGGGVFCGGLEDMSR